MNKKHNCNEKDCCKLEGYAVDLVAYTMKMQCTITRKLEEARAYDCKAEEMMKKVRALECKSDALMKEVEEMSRELEKQLKKANILMLKTIECYKEEKGICCSQNENNCMGCEENNCGHNNGCNDGCGCYEPRCYQPNNCGCNEHTQINDCYRQGYGNNGFRFEDGYNMNRVNNMNMGYGMNYREMNKEEQSRYWYN